MLDSNTPYLIYKLILLVAIISAYLALRGNPKKELRFALVWLMILAVLMLGYSLFR